MCGEKWGKQILERGGRGSPPRVRGEGVHRSATVRVCRITPACAGRRDTFSPNASRPPDHPRVRGEKVGGGLYSWTLAGSPPRARGEDTVLRSIPQQLRITPACAGRSAVRLSNGNAEVDHPRVRGEKSPSMRYSFATRGSPPRARGEDLHMRVARRVARITPACAGRRVFSKWGLPRSADHPRVRGEKVL